MELPICSFETADQLKEIGFDLKVTTHYRYGGDYKEVDLLYNSSLYNMNCKDEQLLWSCGLYSAPTLALVQMWLREKHQIDVSPICTYKEGVRLYHLGIIFINKVPEIDTIIIKSKIPEREYINMLFASWNDALEVGILECIKLIKTK